MKRTASPAKRGGWLDVAEVGSVWGIRFVVRLCTLFGRGAARAFLRALAFYYLLFRPRTRAVSRAYLERVRAQPGMQARREPVTFWSVYRHFCSFADVALDRLLIAGGRRELFTVGSNGGEQLEEAVARGRGGILLGAHLGSFEALRLGAHARSLPVNMVVNFSNAQRIQAVHDQLDPEANTRFISIADQRHEYVLRIRDCIERSELVAILADRLGPDSRYVTVQFLGAPARFAAGPFMLAAALRCPVYLTIGLYLGGNHYELYCEPFADTIELPRNERDRALHAVVQRYAQRLEHYLRIAPDNWFNFYEFWTPSDSLTAGRPNPVAT